MTSLGVPGCQLLTVYVLFLQQFNLAKEQHAVQPAQTVAPHSVNPDFMRSPLDASPVLTHQSKSYPGGQPHLARTPSVSSQGSLDSGASRQVTGP
jgi:hypothetical protein